MARENITYWRCSQFAVFRCRARVKITNSEMVIVSDKHNHDVIRAPRRYGALKEIKRQIDLEKIRTASTKR